LRYHKELKTAEDLEIPEKLKGHKPSPKELEMARTLIDDMADEWQPEKYHDTYHEEPAQAHRGKGEGRRDRGDHEPEKEERRRRAPT